MIVTISLIITLAATIQWIVIRAIPFRLIRIILQIPLLVATVFIAWFVGMYFAYDDGQVAQEELASQILDTAIVIRGDLRVTVDATGALTPIQQVPLSFQFPSFPVSDVLVEGGESVIEGQVLATLSADDIRQAVDDANIAFRLQETAFNAITAPVREEDLAVAQASIDAAEAQLNAAIQTGTTATDREIARLQSEIARNQLWQTQLQRDGITAPAPTTLNIPPIDLDDEDLEDGVNEIVDTINGTLGAQDAAAQAAYQAQIASANSTIEQVEFGVQIADANLQSTQSRSADSGSVASANAALVQARNAYDRLLNGADEEDLRAATLNLELAQLAVAQAELSLRQTQLTAPFSGTIAQQNLVEGELPPQGVSVLLIDNSQYTVELPIDETDIASVREGQVVQFQVDALPNATVTGVVDSIAYTPISAGQLVAYNVRVLVDETEVDIRAGMTVTGSIIVEEQLDVLLIRNNFIRTDRQTGETFVSVRLPNGDIQERQIIVGERNDAFSEVQFGLSAGEEVILLPANNT